MLVKDYMLQHPIMIEPHKRLADARALLVENDIYYLPVVGDGKRFLGMITPPRLAIPPERMASLDVWEISNYLANLTVEKVMLKARDLPTIGPQATLEEASHLMIKTKVGGLPVLEGQIVLGLITDNHLLVELSNLLGAFEPGWRVTVRIKGKRGDLLRLIRAVTDRGWTIMALGNVRTPKKPEDWDVVLKVVGCTREELVDAIAQLEGQVLRDIRETASYAYVKS
ncbi:CBS domain-containing protein [Candidatus Chloroploca sp. M-50]|uniref:CBS domain-containing protein n=1 Tax=Candidatus Chloroploca mongolica TaxID=2528176 RepID=A0ABS4D6L9_9CHLR|nr:CBS domain-containing protein [Candidatus Chloroploca mongolica]MBP1465086.1 CBS domain-containing protein [Candidatus Chloroploca mongolica]